MNKFVLSMIAAFALCVATAVAQSSPAGAQGTQGSSPTMSQTPGANPQPGMNQPGATPSDQNTGSMGNNQPEKPEKGEKKLKGCVQAQGGQATLETKKGKEVALTGQDVSAHNGHEVEVKGTWASGGSMSQTSSGSSGEKTFNVTDVKMISETCKGSKEKGSSSMGTGSSGTNPSGSGSSTGSSPSGTGSTQPQ
jgi:hypothetical protein